MKNCSELTADGDDDKQTCNQLNLNIYISRPHCEEEMVMLSRKCGVEKALK